MIHIRLERSTRVLSIKRYLKLLVRVQNDPFYKHIIKIYRLMYSVKTETIFQTSFHGGTLLIDTVIPLEVLQSAG